MTRAARRRRAGGRYAVARAAGLARASTGARASGLLLVGTAAVLVGAYAFNLVCIRWLGPRAYGDVAVLAALSTILLLPLLGVQAALARQVAALVAAGEEGATAVLARLALRRTLVAQAVGLAALLALSPVIVEVFNINALASAAAAAVLTAAGVLLPVFQGFLQGLDRFARIGFALVVYGLARPVFAMPLILAGFGVAGALTAGTIAALIAGGIVLASLRDVLRKKEAAAVKLDFEDFKPVVFGLFAFTVLANADILVAKAFLPEAQAGTYASASLIGKIAALVPAGTIAPVLLPRATARLERGEDPSRLVSASLAATAAFGLLLTAALFAIPRSVVEWGLGEQFGAARDLLAPSAAVMTLAGIINVNLTFAFALRDRRLISLLGLAVVAQAALFALLHGGPYQILAATALASLLVIVPHEIRSPVSMWRLVRRA